MQRGQGAVTNSRLTGRAASLKWLSLLLVAPVVLAGCSSSSKKTNAGTGGSNPVPSSTNTAKGSPIVLYTITDENTTLQNEPELYGGARAAALAINNSGGIDGHQVVIKNCNEQAQANVAGSCARQVVSDHAVAVVGYSETEGNAIDPVLAQAKIPMVGNEPNQSDDLSSPISFPFQASVADNAAIVAMYYAQQGYTKIGYLELNNPLAVQLGNAVDAVVAKLKTPSGQSLKSYKVEGPLTAADYTPYVASLQKDGVQGVVLLTASSAGGAAMTAASQAGYKMSFGSIGADFTAKAVLNSLGSVADGFVSTSSLPNPTISDSLPGLQNFKTDMAAADKAGIPDTGTDLLDDYSLDAWLSVYAVQEVAAQGITTGDVTSASLYSALQTVKNLTLQGLTPPWTPSKTGMSSEP